MNSSALPPTTLNKLPAEFYAQYSLETIVPPEEMDAVFLEMIKKTLPLLADRDPSKPIYFVSVMQGGVNSGVRFRQLFPLPLKDTYAHVTSYKYAEKPGPLEWIQRPNDDMSGCHVIVYDDVKDSGESLREVAAYCKKQRGAAKVITATLTDKTFKHAKDDQSLHVYGIEIGDVYLGGYGLDLVSGEKPNQYKLFRNIPGMFGKRFSPTPKTEEKSSENDATQLIPHTIVSQQQINSYIFTPSILPYLTGEARAEYINENKLEAAVPLEKLNQSYLEVAQAITMKFKGTKIPPIAMYLVDQSPDFAIPLMDMLNLPFEQDYVHYVREDKEEATPAFKFIQKPHINVKDRDIVLMDRFCGQGYRLKSLIAELYALGAYSVTTVVLGDVESKRENGPNKEFQPDFCVAKIDKDVELVGTTRDQESAKNLLGPGIWKKAAKPDATRLNNTATPESASFRSTL